MNSLQFLQAGMKKWQDGKEEMQCRRQCRRSGISLWHSEIFTRIAKFSQGLRKFLKDCENFARIAKILQGLRKLRNGSENFAILAKFRYGQIFAMIAKFCYHSENSLS